MAGADPEGAFVADDFRGWLPWFAGLYEGEGCVRLGRRSASSAQLALVIKMTDLDVLESVRDRLGMGHVTGPYTYVDGHKPIWVWTVADGASAYALAVAVWPLLHERRRSQITAYVAEWLTVQRTLAVRPTAEERFWAKVDKAGPEFDDLGCCWLWTGSMTSGNYAQLHMEKGPAITAQRFSWEVHYGSAERGANIRVRCGNRRCVRPTHLRNTMLECAEGHAITGTNVLARSERGREGRRCRLCKVGAAQRKREGVRSGR